MKIAVVGSGISGLSSAYYLSKKHKVDLFEKQDRFGGHSYTLDVEYNDKEKVAVDIGFMVFNKITYPNLINFFKENEIEIEKSDMSFSVNVKKTNIEYCGKGLNGSWDGKQLILKEKFNWDDGEIQNREWTINKIDENNYEGTAGDVVGKAIGYSYGPAFKFEYVLLVPVKGKEMKITFDDWIFKQDDRVAINRATMTKFGIKVAELTVVFVKD